MDLLNPLLVDLQLDVPAHAEFYRLCKAHDLTFEFSDDSRAYHKGLAQKSEIIGYVGLLSREFAIAIWNHVVREKIAPDFVEQYLWRE